MILYPNFMSFLIIKIIIFNHINKVLILSGFRSGKLYFIIRQMPRKNVDYVAEPRGDEPH